MNVLDNIENNLGAQLLGGYCICGSACKIGCLNTASWFDYVKQYARAAKLVLDQGENTDMCHTGVYLFRHSVELTLKSILVNVCGKKPNKEFKMNHNLKMLLEKITCNTNLFDYIPEKVILGLHKRDASSFEYRYPVDKKLNETCKGQFCIDVCLITDQCDKLIEFIENLESSQVL